MWWRRSEQTLRAALWNGMNGVTFIVSLSNEENQAVGL